MAAEEVALVAELGLLVDQAVAVVVLLQLVLEGLATHQPQTQAKVTMEVRRQLAQTHMAVEAGVVLVK
jgi:hypothetical protein